MLPGEPLESFGEDIKEFLPGSYNIIMGLTNDYIGYLIPEVEWGNCTNSFKPECFEETIGGGREISGFLKEEFRNLAEELF